ncbi:MoaD family protein [Betaproteobacteria bacterium]|nr:MoaD family protein [Betaproteobacteria bacterium]
MSVTIQIPSALRAFTERKSEIAVEAKTVGEAITALTNLYPDIRPHLFEEEGKLRSFINVYVAGKNVRNAGGVEAAIPDGETLTLVPAIAGGAPLGVRL